VLSPSNDGCDPALTFGPQGADGESLGCDHHNPVRYSGVAIERLYRLRSLAFSAQSVSEANIACAEQRYDGTSLIQINPVTRPRLTLRLGALPSWLRTEHAMRRFCIDKGHCWLIAVKAKTEPGDSIKRRQPSQVTVLKGICRRSAEMMRLRKCEAIPARSGPACYRSEQT
jgi:hypothetical protein